MLALALVAGCTNDVLIHGPVGLGQTAYVGGPRVRPDRVIEDSRCPADKTCVWPGRVVVRATVSGGSWTRPVDLILNVPVAVADGSLTLIKVTPARTAGTSARSDSSRFTFAFHGGL